jgi:hypothetical protein
MMPDVTVVTCYKAGTAALMSVWFESLFRHTKPEEAKAVVLVKKGDFDEGLKALGRHPMTVVEVEVGDDPASVSRVHGKMLDAFVPCKVETEYTLTMDSDCFPVADGWLAGLVDRIEHGFRVSGILHPWAPPPADMKRTKIEWRVRSQHCWENTHVACQLMRTADLAELGAKFAGGDDTGLLIPKMARERKWDIGGYMPVRCPKPVDPDFDPEFNRYVGLVFGDKVFHGGGFTRVAVGDKPVFEKEYGWVREKVLEARGAEFLLDEERSYRFKFDKEEAVAAEKMDRLFGLRVGLK